MELKSKLAMGAFALMLAFQHCQPWRTTRKRRRPFPVPKDSAATLQEDAAEQYTT